MGLRGLLSFYLLHHSIIPLFHYSLIEGATAQINSYDFTGLYKFRDVIIPSGGRCPKRAGTLQCTLFCGY